jgi:glycosyltransferase involved in cell wall biosynthesis
MSDIYAGNQRSCDLTVVVTSFNHQAYVEQCLDSIAAQSVAPRQVIIIDDCSSDDSADVIQNWLTLTGLPYAFIRHDRNVGVCASLNEALALAQCAYFCHVSADDWEVDDRFEKQVLAFDHQSPDTALLVGDIREVDAGGGLIFDHDFGKRLGHVSGTSMQTELLSQLLRENVVPAPGVMMRTRLVREAGGYDETLAFEDYDMWLKLSTQYSLAYESGIVANYRVVGSSLTRDIVRRVSILNSEASMLARHLGERTTNDEIIATRLIHIAGQLLDLRAVGPLRRILTLAMTASREPWIRAALAATYIPGGLRRLRKAHGNELGLAMSDANI